METGEQRTQESMKNPERMPITEDEPCRQAFVEIMGKPDRFGNPEEWMEFFGIFHLGWEKGWQRWQNRENVNIKDEE